MGSPIGSPIRNMRLSDFDFSLPKEFIAQHPLKDRDRSRLMVLNRESQLIEHRRFFELPDLLEPESVLVLNESKVIPARLKFKLGDSNAEILLTKRVSDSAWECMVRPGPKFASGAKAQIDSECSFCVGNITSHGLRTIEFKCDDFSAYLKKHGSTPTPPYIKEDVGNPDEYQTIYAKNEGSVAAPTAGFHFTEKVFDGLEKKGIQSEFITLHVGPGTFQPVKTDEIEEHKMHSEWFELPKPVADRLNLAKKNGKKIVAVGTTSVRVLESCADENGLLRPRSGETGIFIYPGYKWKFVDRMITNFHVPKSTLIMLVSAFAGRDFILKSYETAKKEGYRFFSFGDTMLIR
jgi:S-adenosylmethionine:tRNA ribosyltransferase-isomerase